MINFAILLLFIDLQVKLKDDFLPFSQNFELTLEKLSENNPDLLAAIGDFNAKLRHWYSQDTNTFEGISVENVAFQFRLHQIIKEPMLFLKIHPRVLT